MELDETPLTGHDGVRAHLTTTRGHHRRQCHVQLRQNDWTLYHHRRRRRVHPGFGHFALVLGKPARRLDWFKYSGDRLGEALICPRSGEIYSEAATAASNRYLWLIPPAAHK